MKPESLIRSINSLQQMLEPDNKSSFDLFGLYQKTTDSIAEYAKTNEIEDLNDLAKKMTQHQQNVHRIAKLNGRKKIRILIIFLVCCAIMISMLVPRYGKLVTLITVSAFWTFNYSTTIGDKHFEEHELQIKQTLQEVIECIEDPEKFKIQKRLKEQIMSK